MANMTPELYDALADVIGLSGQGRIAARRMLCDGITQSATADELLINRSTAKRAADKIMAAHQRLAPFLTLEAK